MTMDNGNGNGNDNDNGNDNITELWVRALIFQLRCLTAVKKSKMTEYFFHFRTIER